LTETINLFYFCQTNLADSKIQLLSRPHGFVYWVLTPASSVAAEGDRLLQSSGEYTRAALLREIWVGASEANIAWNLSADEPDSRACQARTRSGMQDGTVVGGASGHVAAGVSSRGSSCERRFSSVTVKAIRIGAIASCGI
jgi:hypothetical protein